MRRRFLLAVVLAVLGLGGLAALVWYATPSAPATPRPSGVFIEADGLRLHAACSGAGRDILLIHGNPGTISTWQGPLWSRLAERHHVCGIDRPGHGFSERGEGVADTVEGQARLLRAAARALGLQRPVVVGHSWGGAVALAYALEAPAQVAAIVLVAGVAYPDDEGFARGAEKIALLPVVGPAIIRLLAPIFAERILAQSMELSFAPDPVPAAYRAHVMPLWVRPASLHAISLDEAALDHSLSALRKRYAELRTPTLIIVGDADRMVDPAKHGLRLREAMPGATLVVLNGAGHELPQTRGQAIAEAIATLRARVL